MKTAMNIMRMMLAMGAWMLVIGMSAVSGQEVSTNTFCPVLVDEAVDAEIHEEFDGRTVYFCCNKCRRKFLTDPAQYAAGLLETQPVPDTEPHDHAGNHSKAGSDKTFLINAGRYLGRLHPVIIHFPIAFILLACAMEWIAAVRTSKPFSWAAGWITGCAALTAVPAALFGWLGARHAAIPSGLEFYLSVHEKLGIAIALLSAAAWFSVWKEKRTLFRMLISVLAVLVLCTGYFGAALVYGPDHLSW